MVAIDLVPVAFESPGERDFGDCVSHDTRGRGEQLMAPILGTHVATSDSTALRYETEDPDVRLMLCVGRDDAGAFEQLVARYQNRLLTLLEHLLGSPDLAEDLAQEVFLRVYRARKTYRAEALFSTWLFTILNNVVNSSRRTSARRREVHLAGGNGSSGAMTLDQMVQDASGLMPTRQLAKAEMNQIVRLAMDSLNGRQRMAVLLSKFEGMSYEEIAESMQLSTKAVKSLLFRARENLREMLEPYLAEGQKPTPR